MYLPYKEHACYLQSVVMSKAAANHSHNMAWLSGLIKTTSFNPIYLLQEGVPSLRNYVSVIMLAFPSGDDVIMTKGADAVECFSKCQSFFFFFFFLIMVKKFE